MITDQMIETAEMIIGNAPRLGATAVHPTELLGRVSAKESSRMELQALVTSLSEPMSDYIVRAWMEPNAEIARDIISTTSEDPRLFPGQSRVMAQVNLLSNAEISYLASVLLKLRQARNAISGETIQ